LKSATNPSTIPADVDTRAARHALAVKPVEHRAAAVARVQNMVVQRTSLSPHAAFVARTLERNLSCGG
jgi:hypothetical protein